ncbi:hypothetical protein LTR17_024251 [Elasticomyces elasticus]|nr:hypothetical protein LTR17_024251 [Elasticomyces elasticus]
MRLALAAALFSCVTSSLTAPIAADIEQRNPDCKVVRDVIDYFTRYTAQASSFCSAYLQTSTTIVVATVAKTATRTRTVHGTTTLYSTATALEKRDRTVARPTWLPDAIGMKLISSACSCYVTPPSPSTIRATATSGKITKTVTSTVATATETVKIYCGVVGCGQADTDYLGGGTGETLQQCKAYCLGYPGCITFIYSAAQGDACGAYGDSVASVYYPGSPTAPPGVCDNQYIYDARCLV